ncbi:MAG: hypothetical protein IKL82_00565 [Clostridia bacterium]|nr:hypothetical protein [Clostridia bacterium]
MKNTEKKNPSQTFEEFIEDIEKDSNEFKVFFKKEYKQLNIEATNIKEVTIAKRFATNVKIVEMVRRSKVLKRTKTKIVSDALKKLVYDLLFLTNYLEALNNIISCVEELEEQVGCPDTSLKNKTTQNGCDVNGEDSAVNEPTNL